MILDLREHSLTIERERGDPLARKSGYSRDGWSREHHLMHHLKRALAQQHGIQLVKVSAVHEGHLLDDRVPILRPAAPRNRALPEHNIGIYDADYMLRSAAEAYNRGERVQLTVVPDYWLPKAHATSARADKHARSAT